MVVDLSTGSDSSYRLADVDISVSQPSAGNHPTYLAMSVYRLWNVGLPTWMGSVYRLGQGRYADMPQPGSPTRAFRYTDMPPLGIPTLSLPTGDGKNCRDQIIVCEYSAGKGGVAHLENG